jgi:competence protein ComEC
VILLALAGAWLAGLGLEAAGFAESLPIAAALDAGAALALLVLKRPVDAALAAACVAVLLLGAMRFEQSAPPGQPHGIALYNGGQSLRLHGLVAEAPEENQTTQRVVVRVYQVDSGRGWTAATGKVMATLRPFPRLEYGDEVEVEGRLETPPVFEDFDYRRYLALRGVASTMAFPAVRRLASGRGSAFKSVLVDARDRFGDALSAALPEPEAALARGMLLGQRASIPPEVNDDFNRAGISHLIAISGSNVSIVAQFAVTSLAWLLGRRLSIVGAFVLIALFTLVVGATPSVVRAAIMGVVMLGAVLAGRSGSALTAVALAAALLTAVSPLAVLDVGFQLSFAATVGLIILARPLQEIIAPLLSRITPDGVAAVLSESVSVTAAASLAVFPITAANFHRVSLVAVPANIVAVPLFTATILLSGVTAAAGLMSGAAGDVAGRFALVPLWALIQIAGAFASLPHATVSIDAGGVAIAVAFYGSFGVVTFVLSRRRRLGLELPRLSPGWALPATVLVLVAGARLWFSVLSADAGTLTVAVLDVGQGDAILITTPAGQRILVDGGPSGSRLLADLSRELPAGAKRIDLVVMTHPQEDHVAGLVDLLSRYDVKKAVVSGTSSDTGAYRAWLTEVAARRVPVEVVRFGEAAELGGGARLEVLSPALPYLAHTEDDLNNNAVVLRLTYGAVSFLLTADLGPEGEARLLSERGDLRATVLKVGHHGSASSSTEDFLTAVRPTLAVISVGADNTYGHPAPSTLLRLAGIPVYRTDTNGTVRFQTDGRRLSARTARGGYRAVPVSSAY